MMKAGTKILLNDFPDPYVVVEWPDDDTDLHAEVTLKTPGRWGTVMRCELGFLKNGHTKFEVVDEK